MKAGAIEGVASIPYGKNEIINSAANDSKLTADIITSALHMNSNDKSTEYVSSSVKKLAERIDLALSGISTEIDIPKNIFSINNYDILEILDKEVKKDERSYKMLGSAKINPVPENALGGHIAGAKAFKNEQYIKIDISFLNKTSNKNA